MKIVKLLILMAVYPALIQAQSISLNTASNITLTTAVLSGSYYSTSNGTFVLAITTNSNLSMLTTNLNLTNGGADTNVSFIVNLGGLSSNTEYYVYARLACLGAVTNSVTNNFLTYVMPIQGSTAVSIINTAASLTAQIAPLGYTTYAWFNYSTNSLLSNSIQTASTNIGSGSSWVAFTNNISNLTYNTTYYFAVTGSNSLGAVQDAIYSFTTANYTYPTATNGSYSPGLNYATMYGTINPMGANTYAWFTYGQAGGVTNTTSKLSSYGAGLNPVQISAAIYGLQTNTTYYYYVTASNVVGVVSNATLNSFTTLVTNSAPANYTYLGDQLASLNPALPGQGEPGYVLGYSENLTKMALRSWATIEHDLYGHHGSNFLQNYMIPDASLNFGKIAPVTMGNSITGSMIQSNSISAYQLTTAAKQSLSSGTAYIAGLETRQPSHTINVSYNGASNYVVLGSITIPANSYSNILIELQFDVTAVTNVTLQPHEPAESLLVNLYVGQMLSSYSTSNVVFGFKEDLLGAIPPHITTVPSTFSTSWTLPGGSLIPVVVTIGMQAIMYHDQNNHSGVNTANIYRLRAWGIK